jgi:UDP-N-acetylglucosamine enolpyruvyl transferase
MTRRVFERLGVDLRLESDYIHLPPDQELVVDKELNGAIAHVDTGPWPQFPSDLLCAERALLECRENTGGNRRDKCPCRHRRQKGIQ